MTDTDDTKILLTGIEVEELRKLVGGSRALSPSVLRPLVRRLIAELQIQSREITRLKALLEEKKVPRSPAAGVCDDPPA